MTVLTPDTKTCNLLAYGRWLSGRLSAMGAQDDRSMITYFASMQRWTRRCSGMSSTLAYTPIPS